MEVGRGSRIMGGDVMNVFLDLHVVNGELAVDRYICVSTCGLLAGNKTFLCWQVSSLSE